MTATRRGRFGIQAYLALVGAVTALPIAGALSILLLRDLHQLRAVDATKHERQATYLASVIRCGIEREATALLLGTEARDARALPPLPAKAATRSGGNADATAFAAMKPRHEVRLAGIVAAKTGPVLLVLVRSTSDAEQKGAPLQRAVRLRDLVRTDPLAQSFPAAYVSDPSGAAWPLDGSETSPRPVPADWITRSLGSGWRVALPRRSAELAAAERGVMREFGIAALIVLFSQLAMLYFVAVHLRTQLAKAVSSDKGEDVDTVISEFAEVRGALSAARQTVGRATRELERAKHDALTGLPGRDLFLARAAAQMHFARELDGYGVAVLFVDLDGFKAINDALGHLAGDEALRRLGAKLRECVRPPDAIARYGGDEFVVCLAAPLKGLEELASSAAKRIKEAAREIPPGLGCSIGWAVSAPGCDLSELIARADAAMYAEKRMLKARLARESLALF